MPHVEAHHEQHPRCGKEHPGKQHQGSNIHGNKSLGPSGFQGRGDDFRDVSGTGGGLILKEGDDFGDVSLASRDVSGDVSKEMG